MKFQHRHYKAIAAVMAELRAAEIAPTMDAVENRLARLFKSDNPRFNCDRFFAACAGRPSNGKDRV